MESEIKKEVISLIEQIEDEDLLQLLKADIEDYKEVGRDITDDLSPEDLEELRILSMEDPFRNTVSEDEYKQFLNKWRTN